MSSDLKDLKLIAKGLMLVYLKEFFLSEKVKTLGFDLAEDEVTDVLLDLFGNQVFEATQNNKSKLCSAYVRVDALSHRTRARFVKHFEETGHNPQGTIDEAVMLGKMAIISEVLQIMKEEGLRNSDEYYEA